MLLSIIFSFLTSWEGKRKRRNGCSQAEAICRQDAWARKEEAAAAQRRPETPHRVRFCKPRSGGLGSATSLLTPPWVSHLKSVRRALWWEWMKSSTQGSWQVGWRTHTIKAQLTVIVLLQSTKAIHAKNKSIFNQNREGDPFGTYCSERETL